MKKIAIAPKDNSLVGQRMVGGGMSAVDAVDGSSTGT
jgi:hypothetical protein